jgi:4-amino-4-deoxy-L-arabinose transferase-like glycosyltransferase
MSQSPATASPLNWIALRENAGRLAGLAAIIAALISGYNFINWDYGNIPLTPTTGLIFAALTGALVLISVLLLRPPLVSFMIRREPLVKAPLNLIAIAVGLVALIGLAFYGRDYRQYPLMLDVHVQFLLFAVGVFALLLGFGVFASIQWRRLGEWIRAIPRFPVFLLIVITLVAFFLRVYRLGDLVHVPLDEDHYYLGVTDLITEPTYPIFEQIGGLAGVPHLLPYFQLWVTPIFGAALDGSRITSMIFGVLTIPAIFLLGRALFDWKLGLIAAAFLAVFPPHIHFSRLVLFNIPDTLFGVLAIAYLVMAFRHNRQRDYVLAGVCLALSGFFYEGGRLLYMGVAGLFVVYTLLTAGGWRRSWRGLLALAVCYLAVSVPYLGIIAFRTDMYFTPRLSMEGVRLNYLIHDLEAGKPLLDVLQAHWDSALQRAFYHVLYWADGSHLYYGGETAILLWYMVPFYLLGLFFVLFRVFRVGFILWVWIVGALLGISLVVSADWTVRFGVMFPAMALLVAVGLRYLPESIWPARLDKRLFWGGLALVMVVGGVVNVVYYFNTHLPILNAQIRAMNYPTPSMDFYDTFYTVSYDKNTTLYYLGIRPETIFNPVLDHEIALRKLDLQYVVEGDASKITVDWLKALPRDRALALAVDPLATDLIAVIKTAFPEATGPAPRLVDTVPERARYLIFRVPAM